MSSNRIIEALIAGEWNETDTPGTYKSKKITHSQTTSVIVENIRQISFDYSVSSENNFDWFNFYINGTQNIHKSGITSSSFEYSSDTPFNIKFEYIKNGSANAGDDCVYISNIKYKEQYTELELDDRVVIKYKEENRITCEDSEYIIDLNNDLWVRGNNEYGKLGCNSDSKIIDNWTKLDYIDNIQNIDFKIYDDNDFVSIINNNDEIYIAGKYNGKNNNKFIKLNTNLFSENKKKYNIYTKKIKINNNKLYYLFSFKKINNFFNFDINLIDASNIINCTISGNDEKGNIYTNYSVNNNKFSIIISKEDEDENQNVFLKVDDFYNKYDEILIKINNIHNIIFMDKITNRLNINRNLFNNEYDNELKYINEYKNGTNSSTPFYNNIPGFKVVSIKKTCSKMGFYYKTYNKNWGYSFIYLYIDGNYFNRYSGNDNTWYSTIIDNLSNEEHEFTWVLYNNTDNIDYYSCIDTISFNDIIETDNTLFNNIYKLPIANIPTSSTYKNGSNTSTPFYNNTNGIKIVSIKKICSKIGFYYKTYSTSSIGNAIYLFIDGNYYSNYISNSRDTWYSEIIDNLSNEEHEFTWVLYSYSSGYYSCIDTISFDDVIETDSGLFSNIYDKELKYIYNNYKYGIESSTPFYNNTPGIKIVSIKKTCSKMTFYYKTPYISTFNSIYLYIDGNYYNSYNSSNKWTLITIDNLSNEEHEFTWVLHCYNNDNYYSCIDTISFDDVLETDSSLFNNKGTIPIADISTDDNYKNGANSSTPFYNNTSGIKIVSTKKTCNKMSFYYKTKYDNGSFNAIYLYIDGNYYNKYKNDNDNNTWYSTIIDNLSNEEHEFTWVLYSYSNNYYSCIDTISFDDIIYNNDFDINNLFIEKTFEINKNGYFGSEIDNYKISNFKNMNNKFLIFDINLDIGNSKSIINDINIKNDEYENKEIIPYEDENYKGPQFLYPIFYNLGIPFDKFIKFEGNITLNGILYPVLYVKISRPIDDENKFGVIQFLFDDNAKLISDVSKSYYIKEYINNDKIKENIFGITFYPIIINENNEYEYKVVNNTANSLVSQNANASWLIRNYLIKDMCNDKIVIKDNICTIASETDIYLFDLISLTPIYTKHFDKDIFNNINYIGIKNISETEYNFVIKCENGINYLLNSTTLNIINSSESDIETENKNIISNEIIEFDSLFITQKIKDLYKNRYQINENESKIIEIKFENDENYFAFIYNELENAYRVSVYRNNMINDGIFGDTENVEIVPSIVESLDGILMCPESIVREGYPKSFEIR